MEHIVTDESTMNKVQADEQPTLGKPLHHPKKARRDFTSGNIAIQLLLFALPFMASNALQVLYSTVDMIIVGRYVGEEGLSAVSTSSLIVNFGAMICLGFSNAGQVMLAQALGAGKRKEMNQIIGTLFIFISGIAIIFTTVFIALHPLLLSLANAPSEAYNMSCEYLIICSAGLIFTAGYNMVSAVLRGMGDSKRPFLFILIASVTNLVLDIIFTGVLGWGVAGAAWATIIGQAVSFIFSLFYLYIKREKFGFEFNKKTFIPNMHYMGMIAKLGTPMAIQSGFINLSMIVVNSLINSVGLVASATFGVGVKIDDIANKIAHGIQFAAVPMISQNIGAKNEKRAKQVVYFSWLYSFILTIIFMVLYVTLNRQLFMIFTDKAEVINMSGEFVKAILWMFPAFAVMRGSGAFIQGIGHTKLGMVLAILDGVALRIGLSCLFGLAFSWGFFGFVLGYALAPYGYAIPSMIYFLSEKWKKRKSVADEL
ncbi:MAG: MATE family efflux transporter [Clostridiales bacterium]|nr:MATE family efflux transporter [Clostridiales bacterium]